MYIHLDHHSGEPIYRQIVEEVKYRVARGRLTGGDQLPSIRALAKDLKINPRTVVKAYEELRHAGLVVMKQGQGVFISSRREAVPAASRRKEITKMARRLLSEASRMGADRKEILDILKSEADRMESQRCRVPR